MKGSSGLIGVRSLLKDLRGTVCHCDEVSTFRDKGILLSMVHPLGFGEEFRDGGRLSKGEGWWSSNN